MRRFPRGSNIGFNVEFIDVDGNPVRPSAATMTISFMVGKERQRVAIPMIQAGNEWIADWDSRVASGGPVYAHARTAAPLPIYAMDFVLVLETNKANPLPAP